jgi:HAD superfamily hydrolase (TIGR01509 family)
MPVTDGTDTMIKGVLLDIDGTLVLSNDAHAAAWHEAFAANGYELPLEDIRRLIGMGGDKLIPAMVSDLDESEGDGKAVKELRTEIFMEQYAPDLRPTPGARQLVEAIRSEGLTPVAASSAKADELDALLHAADIEDLLDDATTADDAEGSKPDPDIIHEALKKAGLQPDEAVMIGDTPYDIEAAGKAGVRCIALRCGGWDDRDLKGALAIYDDPADLLAHRAELGY